ncbi:hypothetical protein MMRN_46130 [Mycobacterium marinum]|nr:hypothetical protein MMRN_46130 [Mycobacterium marinum]
MGVVVMAVRAVSVEVGASPGSVVRAARAVAVVRPVLVGMLVVIPARWAGPAAVAASEVPVVRVVSVAVLAVAVVSVVVVATVVWAWLPVVRVVSVARAGLPGLAGGRCRGHRGRCRWGRWSWR